MSPLLARALGGAILSALRGTLATGTRAYLRLTLLDLVRGAGHDAADRVAGRGAIVAGGCNPRLAWVIDVRWAWLVSLLSFLPLGLAPFRMFAEARQRGYWVNVLMTVQCLLITALRFCSRGPAGVSRGRPGHSRSGP